MVLVEQSARDAQRVKRGMITVIVILIMGAIGLAVGAVVMLANGHWWVVGPLVLLGATVWGLWWLSGAYNDPFHGRPQDGSGDA